MTASSLKPPPASLARFPHTKVPARLIRICRRGNGTWWFSSDRSGRFDLPPPDGTCYFATDAFGALREASRGGPVTPEWVAARESRTVTPPALAARLAATTHVAAAKFGLTKELVTILPYTLPHLWAEAFHAHGLAGIRHELRHDVRAKLAGVSLFGPAGAPDWPNGTATAITTNALRLAGVDLKQIPPSSAVTIID